MNNITATVTFQIEPYKIDSFYAYRHSKLYYVLQLMGIVRAGEADHMQVVGLLHVLHPLVGLAFRINHQWKLTRISGTVCEQLSQPQALTQSAQTLETYSQQE
jgi:hypothetical protein